MIRFRVIVRTRMGRPQERSVRVTFVLGRRRVPAGSDLKISEERSGADQEEKKERAQEEDRKEERN